VPFKILTIILFIILAFSEKIIFLLELETFNGIRQIILLLFCTMIYFYSKKNILDKRLIILISIFVIFSLLNYFLIPNTIFNFTYGLFSTLSFILTYFLLNSAIIKLKSVFFIFNSCLLLIFISSLISLFSITLTQDFRLQFTFFRELGAYGVSCVYAIIISLTMNLITRNNIYIYVAIFFLFCIFTTLLKKSIFDAVLIFLIFIYYRFGTVLKIYYTTIITFFIIIFLLYVGSDLKDNLLMNVEYYTTTKSEGVRQIMYVSSLYLASINFPFGSGMGTFGTPASLINGYNNTYYQTGISAIPEMSADLVMDGKPNTLFDTFWPHIIGETGFIGTILFLFLWFYPLYYVLKNKKIFNFYTKFYIICSTLIMTLDGLTLFVPELPLFIMFHICFFVFLRNSFMLNNLKSL